MSMLKPTLHALHVLAGEGDRHLYRLLNSGRRMFLFTKCLLTTLAYFRAKGKPADVRSVAFVKGPNQLRYHQHARNQFEAELGTLRLYTSTPLPGAKENSMLPGMTLLETLQQAAYLTMMFLTGKKRYLNLYLLAFGAAINKATEHGLPNVQTFLCYNDQPYDVAAILLSLNNRKNCRTIVIQHGLILSEKFYFPSVAKEFWAWGELSKKHYCSWDPKASIIIKGRYRDDASKKQEQIVLPTNDRPIRILVAPSFAHDEVKKIVLKISDVLKSTTPDATAVAIKFHPATKFRGWLKLWCKRQISGLHQEADPMEALAEKYDVLITKNSTSSIDFLLRGKPVFFFAIGNGENFPSTSYGLDICRLSDLINDHNPIIDNSSFHRNKFLHAALNV